MKLDFRTRFGVIKSVLSNKPYFILFSLFLIGYFSLNLFINQFYEILPFFLSYNLVFVIPYFLLTTLIGIGVALNLTIVIYKLRQILGMKKEMGMTAFGAVGGMLGGACPGCFVGLLPALAGVFGLTVTLSSLPFLGFEIQIPTFLLVAATLFFVAKPLTCNVEVKK